MAANSIGSASLVLTSNGTGLLQDLNGTSTGIKSWADKTKATLAGALKVGGAGAAGGVAGGVLGGLKGSLVGIGAGIGTLFGPVGTAVGGAVGGVISTIAEAVMQPFDKLKEFSGIVKQAATLGIGASQLQGMQKQLAVVGIEADQTGQLFASMGKNIADGAGGHGRAAPAFKQLGIDAKALLALPVDEQFKSIADSISKLPPGAAQASAAMHIFGGEGAKLLPILQKGGQGIQEFIELNKKTGAVLSDSQLKAAADAQAAWKKSKVEISAVWDGLVNRATLIAAPIIKFVGGVVSKAFKLLTPVFEWLGRIIAKTADILEQVFEVMSGWFDEVIQWVTELIGEVEQFGGGWPTIEQVVVSVLKNIAIACGYVWDTLKAGIGVASYVIGFIVQGFGKLVDQFKDTIKSLLEIAGNLPDDLGGKWFRDQAKNVDKLGSGMKAVGADMMKFGKDSMNAFGESPKKIEKWFDKLKTKKDEAFKILKDEPEAAPTPKPYSTVQAALKGSKEAYEIEARYKFGDQGKKVDEQQLDAAKVGNQIMSNVLDALRASPVLKQG